MGDTSAPFEELVEIVAALRAPDGCPWDREQTHQSLARNMVEEAYEALDAIESGSIRHLQEELGDVLLQVVLHAQIAADNDEFTIEDVCRGIGKKLIRRHPHVFGDEQAHDAAEVLTLWEKEKLKEYREQHGEAQHEGYQHTATSQQKSLLDSVPTSAPALLQAQKISKKAVSAGFEWNSIDEVWEQVYSEIEELKQAFAAAPKTSKGSASSTEAAAFEAVELEMGDVLFSFVNIARKMGVDAESALRAGNRKFRNRWSFIEGQARKQGREVDELSMEEMEEFWAQAKREELLPRA